MIYPEDEGGEGGKRKGEEISDGTDRGLTFSVSADLRAPATSRNRTGATARRRGIFNYGHQLAAHLRSVNCQSRSPADFSVFVSSDSRSLQPLSETLINVVYVETCRKHCVIIATLPSA